MTTAELTKRLETLEAENAKLKARPGNQGGVSLMKTFTQGL